MRVAGAAVRLHNLLQVRHPRDRQVAVLQEHPVAHRQAVLDHLGRHGCLALAERTAVELDAHRLCERLDLARRVDTGREHEDKRRASGGRLVDTLQVERGRVHEHGAQVVGHELRHGEQHTIGAQGTQDDHRLQFGALRVPLAWQRLVLRRSRHVPPLPVARRLVERADDATESTELIELSDVVPGRRVEPVGHRVGALLVPVHDKATPQEEVPLLRRDLGLALHLLDADLQGQQQLVALEQTTARVLVHLVRVEGVDRLDTLSELIRSATTAAAAAIAVTAVLNAHHEQVDVRVERELVHRVDRGKIVEHEEQERGAS
mmetsp:Transcript_110102/g.267689  ORF Transcript_110102/g.267689 Transcript_110102/m.267689 type:complete len:319 (+) Transcript_110102:1560-2516(+)